MTADIEIQAIAAIAAAACAVPGAFLVLRRMAMLTDAITHAVLPGIVIAFFWFHDLSSPWLIVGAALSGLVTVWLVELLFQSGTLRQDAAIGVVFPAMFALGVFLISRYAADIHLDIDVVLLGELAFAPFDRLVAGGMDLGPKSLWAMAALFAFNVALAVVMYKEFKLASFDPQAAAAMGLAPVAIHYLMMASVSLTAVGAFDVVGAVLVVALFIGPPATAYLLTDRLPTMLALGAAIGASEAVVGYQIARALDVSIAGCIAVVVGLGFGAGVLLSPQRGVLVEIRARHVRRLQLATNLLLVHLLHHEANPGDREAEIKTLSQHLSWTKSATANTIDTAATLGFVQRKGEELVLTEQGREIARGHVTQ